MTAGAFARRALAATLLAGAFAASAGSATADPAGEGLWYFDALHIQDAHDAGFTGAGLTVAVLDSQINPGIPTLRDANLEFGEQPECYVDGVTLPPESTDIAAAVHGTNVVSLLIGTGAGEGGLPGVKGVAPGATVLFYRIGQYGEFACTDAAGTPRDEDAIADALDAAIDAGSDIISMSIGFSDNQRVVDAVARGLANDVIFVSALANQDGTSLLSGWSTYLNGGVSVQAIGSDAAIQTHEFGLTGERAPNTDPDVDVAAPGLGILFQGTADQGWAGQSLSDGTSLATPLVAGFLAVTAQKYPDATPNQLLQSLIHNTGGEDHDLSYDPTMQYGYGIASLTHLLRVDPTQYPDENPLLTDTGDPSLEAIAAAEESPAEPSGEPSPGPGAASGIPGWVIGVLVGGTILVLAIVAVVIVIAVRRSSRAGT